MTELSKAYEPQAVEAKWYARWLADGCFPGRSGFAEAGLLHRHPAAECHRRAHPRPRPQQHHPGHPRPPRAHARQGSALAARHGSRRHRHADGGRERQLRKEEGKTRHDLGREEFVRRIWEWKEKHGGIIIEQLKRLGCSCDWSRERFTMDADYSRAVQQVFVDLYKKGLIYRGKRMVNWCPVALTALSDEEVIMKPQKSALYYVRYELVEEPGQFHRGRDHAAGNDPGRRRARGASERRALPRIVRQKSLAPARSRGDCRSSATTRSIRRSAPAC